MGELMKELGVSSLEELARFVIDNPNHKVSKALRTFFELTENEDPLKDEDYEVKK